MKRIFVCLLMVVLILSFASCGDVVGNRIHSKYLQLAEIEGQTCFVNQFSTVYGIDLSKKTFARLSSPSADTGELRMPDKIFEYRYFAGEYFETVPEECEIVPSHLQRLFPCEDGSVIYVWAEDYGGYLVGYVQVYGKVSDATGNYAVEEIDYSVLFRYGIETDEFIITDRLEDAVVVAVGEDDAVYWKECAYYRYDDRTEGSVLLLEDPAYDAGLSQLSWSEVLSNADYCILHFNVSRASEDRELMYVLEYETDAFYGVELINSQKN